MRSEVVPCIGVQEVYRDDTQSQGYQRDRRQRFPKAVLFCRRAFHESPFPARLFVSRRQSPSGRDSTSFCVGEQVNGRRTLSSGSSCKEAELNRASGFAAGNHKSLRFVTVLPSAPLLTIKLFSRKS